MLITPSEINASDMYKLMIGSVTPRPIAWVSTMSLAGIANLAPFSFYTVASANPPVLCFNPMHNDQAQSKDTLNNIREQGEFVVNTVSFKDLSVMNQTCHNLNPKEDEFEYAGLNKLASEIVAPSRVENAVVSFECRLNQIVDLGQDALSGHLVLGDVVAVHVSDDAIDNYRIDSDKVDTIGRMAGSDYCRTKERVQLDRS